MVDDSEKIANRTYTKSMILFGRILSDLPHDGFTADDVRDSFNPLVKKVGCADTVQVRFGKSHLGYLVRTGFLDYDEATLIYSVNLTSPNLAREIFSDEEKHTLMGFDDEYDPY